MTKVHKGDIIISNVNKTIKAVSIARSDCYEKQQPDELRERKNGPVWNQDGYMIDVEYHEVSPLDLGNYKDWILAHPDKASAFQNNGRSKEVYLSVLSEEHARYFLKELLSIGQSVEIEKYLKSLLSKIQGLEIPEYDLDEKTEINELIEADLDNETTPKWNHVPQPKEFVEAGTSDHLIPKRNAQRAVKALKIAGYKCEYNPEDRVFLRKNGKHTYTEPHHLIPISNHADFNDSLDVEENIVSLCSHCHNLLHYGCFADKKSVLDKLYKERQKALSDVGILLHDVEDLYRYYK